MTGLIDDLIARLEADLRGLLKGEYSSLTISFNEDHACNYETANQWRDYSDPESRIDWVSEEEREKALAENSVWTCQWYPNTPVGFNCIGASSLTALIAALTTKPSLEVPMAKRLIRPIRIEGNAAYVTLTKGHTAVIDAADIPLVEGRNWFAFETPRTVYAACTDILDGKRRTRLMHRTIMDAPDGLDVDHIDSDGLNNSRSNLRLATRSENMQNQRPHSDNASGLKGASWDKQNGKWVAKIMLRGRRRHLGYYATPEAAHAAYAAASAELHGEFGRI